MTHHFLRTFRCKKQILGNSPIHAGLHRSYLQYAESKMDGLFGSKVEIYLCDTHTLFILIYLNADNHGSDLIR